jgi:hypothetical protein
MSRSQPGRPGGQGTGPIVVLTFGYSGADSLTSALAGYPGLACTSGTGILPLCAHAARTWQQLEGSPAGMSAMAASSVRALAATMITCTLAAVRGNRWCETATAPATAGAFAELFPQARFVCFYRACAPVIAEATQASQWGLGSAGIADFPARYQGNSVAAVAAYWCARTSEPLDFETAYPRRSMRVRQEDQPGGATAASSSIAAFLGLDERQPPGPAPSARAHDTARPADPQIPAGLIPAPMLDRVNGLHARLGYPALTLQPEPARTG